MLGAAGFEEVGSLLRGPLVLVVEILDDPITDFGQCVASVFSATPAHNSLRG